MPRQKFTSNDDSYLEEERGAGSDKVNPLSYGSGDASPRFSPMPGKSRVFRFVVFVLLILVAAGLAQKLFLGASSPRIDGDKWQAVFLNNNQVYFGKLRESSRDYLQLENIFYLRANAPLQQGATAAPELSLVKLGGELHGPEDMMYIPKSNVLFWENMKADSEVVQAISNFLQSEGR